MGAGASAAGGRAMSDEVFKKLDTAGAGGVSRALPGSETTGVDNNSASPLPLSCRTLAMPCMRSNHNEAPGPRPALSSEVVLMLTAHAAAAQPRAHMWPRPSLGSLTHARTVLCSVRAGGRAAPVHCTRRAQARQPRVTRRCSSQRTYFWDCARSATSSSKDGSRKLPPYIAL